MSCSRQDSVIFQTLRLHFFRGGDVGLIRNCQDTNEIRSRVICEFNSSILLNGASVLVVTTAAGANQEFSLSLKGAL